MDKGYTKRIRERVLASADGMGQRFSRDKVIVGENGLRYNISVYIRDCGPLVRMGH